MSRATELDEYSVLSNTEGRIIEFDFFVLSPLFLTLAFGIFVILSRDMKALSDSGNTYQIKIYVVQCTRMAVLFAVLICITQIFFCNDFIVRWDYTSNNNTFVTTSESIVLFFYLMIKIAFYCGFTFHLQSILYSHDGQALSVWLKTGMVLITIYFIAVGIAAIADDAMISTKKEIGIDTVHNIYVTMTVSHEKDAAYNMVEILSISMVVVDLLYFGVLLFLYSSKSRSMDAQNKQKAVKGLVLVISSCVFYWIFLISLGMQLPFRYVTAVMDVVADYMCLFAVVGSGKVIYDNLCGCLCHDCCGALFLGTNYTKVDSVEVDKRVSDDDQSQTDHLL